MMDTSDEWIISAPASASAASAAPRSACRSSRAGRRWRWPGSIRCASTDSSSPPRRPTSSAGNAGRGPERARTAVRRVRRQRRVLGLRVRPRSPRHGLIAMGADRVLVIGTDTLSRIIDWDDRGTAILFADGSGAVVLEAVDGPGQMLGWDLDADGSAGDPATPRSAATCRWTARRSSGGPCGSWSTRPSKSMAHAGVTADDIALVVPHQANIRIIDAACDRLGIPMERAAIVLAHDRQHVVGVDPAGPGRRARRRAGSRRRPRAARRLRRRDDRRPAPSLRWGGGRRLSRVSATHGPGRARHRRRLAASVSPAPSASPRTATASP